MSIEFEAIVRGNTEAGIKVAKITNARLFPLIGKKVKVSISITGDTND